MESPVRVEVPGGPVLDGRLTLTDAPVGGLVLCHPHPLYGGDMDNPVVVRAAEVAQALGVTTLRFNFRGVGASDGVHDQGSGEQDDCQAVLAALRSCLGAGSPMGLLGYSFGAWVAGRVAAAGAALSGLCLVAPPLAMYGFDALAPGSAILLVGGSRDPYCPADQLRQLGERLGAEVRIIEGAEHLFFGKLFPLGEAVEGWVRGWTSVRP